MNGMHNFIAFRFGKNAEWYGGNDVSNAVVAVVPDMFTDVCGRFIVNLQAGIFQQFKVIAEFLIHFESIQRSVFSHQLQEVGGNAAIAGAQFNDAGGQGEINIPDDFLHQAWRTEGDCT